MKNMGSAGKTQGTQRDVLLNKYTSARSNLLLAIAFTVVNTVLLLSKSATYFLFSLYVPYQVVGYGMVVTGNMPEEFYGDMSGLVFKDNFVLIITLAIAAAIILVFLLCWLFSKNGKPGWLIAALVLFVVDTVLMFLNQEAIADAIIDIVFHFWVMASLAGGIKAYYDLKNLPQEEVVVEEAVVVEKVPAEVEVAVAEEAPVEEVVVTEETAE